MQWVDSVYSVVKSSDILVLELDLERIECLFNIFRVLVKVQVCFLTFAILILTNLHNS